jgi:RNase P subunit RPR2
MSRTAPLEVCALCEMLKPTSEMVDIRIKNEENGEIVTVRFCRKCAEPRLTYIQSKDSRGGGG